MMRRRSWIRLTDAVSSTKHLYTLTYSFTLLKFHWATVDKGVNKMMVPNKTWYVKDFIIFGGQH